MNDLQTLLNAIKLDKDTNLTVKTLKDGVTCLGIDGNYQQVKFYNSVEEMKADAELENNMYGIIKGTKPETDIEIVVGVYEYVDGECVSLIEYFNTFDADATSDDIAYGKIAYIDGQKVVGTIQTHEAGANENKSVTLDKENDTYAELINSPMRGDVLRVQSTEEIDNLYRATAIHQYDLKVDDLATLIELTPDKIIEGNTILGVVGTGFNGIRTYTTIEELEAVQGTQGDVAVVMGDTYEGTYEYDGTQWVEIFSDRRYEGTITPEEYQEAKGTASDILGE